MTDQVESFMSTIPQGTSGNTPFAERYAREIRGVVTRHASMAPRSLQVHLGPSEIGAQCHRQIVWKLLGTGLAPRTNHVSDPWPSVVGTAVHAWLADAFLAENRRENLLRWLTEVRVVPHPDYPGHSDLYDALEELVGDHKVLGPTSLAKVKSPEGPPRKYKVQLLLYGAGFRNLGFSVKRVALIAYPRTASTLDGLYVWSHDCGPDDEILLNDVFRVMAVRQEMAQWIREGRMTMNEVPAIPDDSECFFCPFYRPQSSYDGGYGCPGTLIPRQYALNN